jgi:hypothetical protein
VNKSVDNRIQVRITTAVLWIKKNLSIIFSRGLRSARERSRNSFTAGNGHHSEETPGTWEELGNWHLVRVLGLAVGRRSRASWETGQPGEAGQAGKLASLVRQAEQGPLHPIYGGGLVLLCPNRTPRQLTTRRQKVAVTNMLGNSAMTGTWWAALGCLPASRGALVSAWDPSVNCMPEAHGSFLSHIFKNRLDHNALANPSWEVSRGGTVLRREGS